MPSLVPSIKDGYAPGTGLETEPWSTQLCSLPLRFSRSARQGAQTSVIPSVTGCDKESQRRNKEPEDGASGARMEEEERAA